MPQVTTRLYRADPYRRAFEATVIAQERIDGAPAVVLDATCFYPTSGGQPHDTGTLNGVPVVGVEEADDRILHILASPLPLGPVHGVIDWSRRFDHMQQHTGQHILSQAFERVLGAATVSFHLGTEMSTIDLALAELDWGAAAQVEDLANAIVAENRPVSVQEYEEGELSAELLRRLPTVEGRIRIVTIADFDACACGGTHVRATAEVGGIHILRWERRRDQVRVEFLCGGRAWRDHHRKERMLQSLTARASVGWDELPAAWDRLTEAERAARKELEALRDRLIALELPHWAGQAEALGPYRVVSQVLEGYNAAHMRYIAQQLTQQPGVIALLAVREPAPQLCFTRSADVALDMAQLFREVTAPYGGRGGGKPHFAQGGGVAASELAAVLSAARDRVREQAG